MTNETPLWKQRRTVRLAECRAAIAGGDDPHPLEAMVTILRIETAEARERELDAMAERRRPAAMAA
jgi:hypothetical protein